MGIAKWIGGVLGWMTLGPLGALAGYALGKALDNVIEGDVDPLGDGGEARQDGYDRSGGTRSRYAGGQGYSTSGQDGYSRGYGSARTRRQERQQGNRNSFLFSLLVLTAEVIASDGKIMHSEMEHTREMIRRSFGAQAVEQANEILLRLFEKRRSTVAGEWQEQIDECCAIMRAHMSLSQRLQIVAFLCDVVKADGVIAQAEVEAVKRIAAQLGIGEGEVNQLLNLGEQGLDEAYRVLGIAPDATDDEVKKAYRRMALRYHPDKVAGLGEDVRKQAETKFKELNDAKERIYAARGMA